MCLQFFQINVDKNKCVEVVSRGGRKGGVVHFFTSSGRERRERLDVFLYILGALYLTQANSALGYFF
jgi:hypothetical protein